MTQPAFKLAVVVDNTLPAGLAANAAAVMTLTLGHLWFPPNRGGLPYAVLGRPWAVLVS